MSESRDLSGPTDRPDPFAAVFGRTSFWVSLLLPLGLFFLFFAERVLGTESDYDWYPRIVAFIALGALGAWRVRELVTSTDKKREVELRLTIATAGVFVALFLYLLSSDVGVEWTGYEGPAAERWSGSLGALWVAVLVSSWSALFFMEMAYRGMVIEDAIEVRRVSSAGAHGLGLALAFVFVASVNFIASEREVREDLSYLQTTQPSETSIQRVSRLDEPVRAVLLFPRVSDVLSRVQPYFAVLDEASEQFSVEVMDHALASELVERHRVPRNGFVLLLRGEGDGQQAESFEIGTELESARSRLRTLDGRFQQSFAQLTIRPRELHLTAGHRERSGAGADGDQPGQRLGELQAALGRANIASQELGVAQGLANEVPEGVRALAVIGPREPFLAEEAESLLRYARHGGRLVVFVDPDVDHGLSPLFAGLGLTLRDGVLHSASAHLRHGPPPANRAVVYSNQYSAHPTVSLANRFRSQVASVLDRGGALARAGQGDPEGVSITFPLRTDRGFWLDTNGNHEQDAGEVADDRFYPMASVTVANAESGGEEGRVVIMADGDFITDQWIGNRGNAFILMDTLNWLVGEESVLGPTQSEEDVPIEHTQEGEGIWFWATSCGLPIPLFLMGVFLVFRSTVKRRSVKPRPSKRAPARAHEEEE